MAFNTTRLNPQAAAEKAVSVIGFGYDLTSDISLSACKSGQSGSLLIELDRTLTRDLVFPDGIVVPNVSTSIKCDMGERLRFQSDVLSFNQMSEEFNQILSLSGKIPSGLFNTMFNFEGCWEKDEAATKSLAFGGWFIALYNIMLSTSQIALSEHVKQELPSSWDPAALAEFIEKYGTHVIVGVKMGGKDVIHIKQLQNSNLQPTGVQKLLKQISDERFVEDVNGNIILNPDDISGQLKDIVRIHARRGGVDIGQSHNRWLSTVSQSPNVISMSFVPIASLLSGVTGRGFLSHAINLYLRYKPPIEELHQFLEFQLPRQWAPMYGDLPLGPRHKKVASPSLQFTFMGPKLYVNTPQVDSGNRPVTGIRLYLEGKKCDHLAIQLQHLSNLPKILQLSDDHSYEPVDEPPERGYFEPVKWRNFSHVCTAPVQHNGDSASIVTKAWFEVRVPWRRKVLFLRLGFSTVASARIRRSEWDEPTTSSRKSGLLSMLDSRTFSTGPTTTEKPPLIVGSDNYPTGPPLPTRAPKLSNFVDTKEMVRGPQESPGYWVVSGAKLCIEGGRISIKVKYSLLTIMADDSM